MLGDRADTVAELVGGSRHRPELSDGDEGLQLPERPCHGLTLCVLRNREKRVHELCLVLNCEGQHNGVQADEGVGRTQSEVERAG
ncbi:Uncharacterised protein [Mycobacteroides abscessus subsp. abscessus]|nr:Uncharacterised protein [Mycobacteroides abscessus subsp. abscessus]